MGLIEWVQETFTTEALLETLVARASRVDGTGSLGWSISACRTVLLESLGDRHSPSGASGTARPSPDHRGECRARPAVLRGLPAPRDVVGSRRLPGLELCRHHPPGRHRT